MKCNLQKDKYGNLYLNLDYKQLMSVLKNCRVGIDGEVTLVIDHNGIKLHKKNVIILDDNDKF